MKTPNTRGWAALLSAGVLAVGLAGCADRNNNGQPDSVATEGEVARTTENAENNAENAAKNASNTAENALDNAANSAHNAGEAAGNAANNAGKAIGNALEPAVVTPNVKEALGDNAQLKGSMIDVDTNGTTNTVVLKGTVKSNAQKQLAGQIAQREAKGYKINNTLKVQP